MANRLRWSMAMAFLVVVLILCMVVILDRLGPAGPERDGGITISLENVTEADNMTCVTNNDTEDIFCVNEISGAPLSISMERQWYEGAGSHGGRLANVTEAENGD
jgi:hypothetical protein